MKPDMEFNPQLEDQHTEADEIINIEMEFQVMEKLISMVDYVLENEKQPYIEGTKYKDIINYASFLKQPLTLGMFVPCDLDGNVLEDPRPMQTFDEINEFEDRYEQYKEALEKCFFSGYKVISENQLYVDISDGYNLQFRWVKEGFFMFNRNVTIEKFSEKYDLQLSQTAKTKLS